MRKILNLFLLVLCIVIISTAIYLRTSAETWQSIATWAESHQGTVGLIGLILTSALIPIIKYIWEHIEKAEPKVSGKNTLEHNYLRQLEDLFVEMQRHPLIPEESQIMDLGAEVFIEPKYRVSKVSEEKEPRSDKGRIISNLVKLLLKNEHPVVVLN